MLLPTKLGLVEIVIRIPLVSFCSLSSHEVDGGRALSASLSLVWRGFLPPWSNDCYERAQIEG